uniref:Uncharacterized protein n=1 Tax=Sphaerodactylus townsendi TaxID=933632 RepID=A0ACB8G3U8_9SAUR
MEMKILEAKADAAAAAKQVDFLKRKEEIIEEQAARQAQSKAQEAAHQAHQAQLKAQEEARQAKSSNFGEVTADSEEFRVTEHLAAAGSAELMSQMSRVQQSMVQFQPQHSMVAPVVVSQQTVPQKELPQVINKQSQLANEQNEGRKTFTNPVGMPNFDSTVFRQEQKSPEDTVVPGVSASQLYSTPHHQATNPIMQPDIPNLSDVLKATLSRNPRRDLADRGIQKFSDKPEDYLLWKITFQRALKDLGN